MQHKKKQIKRTESIDEQKADDLRKNKEEASDCSVSSDEIVKLQRQVKEGHLKISVVPIATSAKNPCTPKEEKWQVLYPMDL